MSPIRSATVEPVHAPQASEQPTYVIVIPTVGRPCLVDLLRRLGDEAARAAHGPREVVIVDDRCRPEAELPLGGVPASLQGRLRVVGSGGRGPAAARNAGWTGVSADWVVFVDDDVLPEPGWMAALERELAEAPSDVGAVQAQIMVPLPDGEPPSDWQRDVAGLQGAPWITADLAYRRGVLSDVGGFDERFPRAYREDVELALRVGRLGYGLLPGRRRTLHPVRPAPWWVSLRRQRGNADDALLRRLYGPAWRRQAGLPAGRRRRHAVVAVSGVAAALLIVGRRHPRLAATALGVWGLGTAELAWARIAPGPRTRREIAAMAVTSAAMPYCAVAWYLFGAVRARRWPANSTLTPKMVSIERINAHQSHVEMHVEDGAANAAGDR